MINNNKILTVSYGTFSCTLEGFDDSFGTMKAIAEYFRDLAADDRYFGAEPPQPDAQMLARIAQREISRHVEAREDDGRIVLSAQEASRTAVSTRSAKPDVEEAEMQPAEQNADSPAAPAADDAPEPLETEGNEVAASDDEPMVANSDDTEDTDAQDDEADLPEASAEEDEPEDSVFIVDTEGAARSVAPEDAQAENDVSTDVAENADEASAEAEDTAEEARDIVPALPDEEVEAFFADSATDISSDMEDDAEEARVSSAASNSIAEKLKRIRAVVSQQSIATETLVYAEDQHAEASGTESAQAGTETSWENEADDADVDTDAPEKTERQNDVVSATLRDIEDALDADDAAEAPAASDGESEDDDVAAILSRLDREDDASHTQDADDAESDEDDADSDENILAGLTGYDDDLSDDDDTEDSAQDTADVRAGAAEDDDESDGNLFNAETPDADAPSGVAPASETPRPAPRTRVLKVKRATLEAAIKVGQLEEYYDEDDEEDAPSEATAQSYRKAPLADRSSLSDAEEDELARELAALEADMGESRKPETAAEEPRAESDASPEQSEPAQAVHADMPPNADDDFSRLMAETDNQMEEPESATRRDAFTHLRAAVVAKKADEAVGGKSTEKEADEAYRDDLANVVRPRRPVATERARTTERPAEQRAAPLRLVAEQRIDVQNAAASGPVRPRRVASVTDTEHHASIDDEGSFEDFVDEVGAHKLPDLLEAAAAYIAFVEGQQNFSRPQLMNKVRQVEKDNFTREDGLRSFGKLLREGKIEKLKGGRFQVSEQIGFKPDARAAS